MAANIDDLITAVRSGSTNAPVTTVASSRSIDGTSLVCDDLTGWPTDTAIHLQTYKKTAAGTKDFTTAVDMKGIVSSNTIGSIVIENGTDAGNDVGDFVELAPTGAWAQDLYDGLTAEHNVDGTHADVTATSVTSTGNINTSGGKVQEAGHDLIPSGVIQMFGGSTAPSGWLLCDGSAVSRTTYSNLFSAISTSYGAGNGTSTFNVPDLRGKVPVGLNSSDTDFATLGNSGGEKTHVLTTAEVPSHTHTITARPSTTGGSSFSGVTNTATGGAVSSSLGVSSVGGDGAHNNLQPYLVVNHIIKT